jgi:probable F420-dependent oxidoreductase
MTRPFRFGVLGVSGLPVKGMIEQAVRAEALGYSTYLFPDHLSLVPAAPIPMLAYAASVTTGIRLGTLVLNNDLRNPAVLAKELATVDALSDGRLEIGIGAGWFPADYSESGIQRDPAGRRIARLEESFGVLDGLLRGDPNNRPQCVQSPRPPILIGGASPKVLGLAGRCADIVGITWQTGTDFNSADSVRSRSADATDEKLRWVREMAGSHASQLEFHMSAIVEVTERADEALDALSRGSQSPVSRSEFLGSPHCLIGPVGSIVDRLHEVRERWGFSYISVPDTKLETMAPVVAELAGK